jgi:hypothetical protein
LPFAATAVGLPFVAGLAEAVALGAEPPLLMANAPPVIAKTKATKAIMVLGVIYERILLIIVYAFH